ncbi:MAG: KH domain-containing protein [Thermotogae bacterium]|nr:KH domain-containing protein [Thermotogota bacterium]
MRELLEYIIKALVDNQDQVAIREIAGQKAVIYEIEVAPEDKAKIIGRQGKTANAIRRIVEAVGRKQGKVVKVEII